MIEAKNISKWFDGQRILYDVSATFETGKTNLIIGQSGSGKTVFMKCLIGLLTPEKGEITYDGRLLRDMNSSQRKQLRTEIGMLFQGSVLFDNETVLGNVMFPLKMFSRQSYKEQLERARFCISRVGLTNADDKYPSEISGGMQKRVAIARAIARRCYSSTRVIATGPVMTRQYSEAKASRSMILYSPRNSFRKSRNFWSANIRPKNLPGATANDAPGSVRKSSYLSPVYVPFSMIA